MVVSGNKLSLLILSYLRSILASIGPNYLYYHDLSLWSLVLTFHAQTILSVFFHLVSSANSYGDLQIAKGPTYFIATFLNWLVNGDLIYTKSPLLY